MRYLWRAAAGFLLSGLYSMFVGAQQLFLGIVQKIVAPVAEPLSMPFGSDKTVIAVYHVAGLFRSPYFWIPASAAILTAVYGLAACFLVKAVEDRFDRRAVKLT